ncbi:MAG: hypothetical protein ACI9O0_000681 [Paracoccaceae bacterium]|jgi:hypothetical protein
MSQKTHLMELMRKKEKIMVQRRALALGDLNSEHTKTKGLGHKLNVMIAENQPQSGTVLHPQMLGNTARLSGQLAEQRDLTKNRMDFLQTEISAAQKLLASHQTRETLLKDRIIVEKRAHQEQVQVANDALLPPQLGKLRR